MNAKSPIGAPHPVDRHALFLAKVLIDNVTACLAAASSGLFVAGRAPRARTARWIWRGLTRRAMRVSVMASRSS